MSWLYFVLRGLMADGQVLQRSGNALRGVDVASLAPAGHFSPATTNTYDLGVTGTRWRTLYLGTSLEAPTVNAAAANATVSDTATNAVSRPVTLSHTISTGTPAAGVGVGVLLRAPSAAGTARSAGAIDALHTDVTDGAEVSTLAVRAGIAGTLYEVARFTAVASAVNRAEILAASTGDPVTIVARGDDANVALVFQAKGSGRVALVDSGDVARVAINTTGILVDSAEVLTASPEINCDAGVVQIDSGATSVTVTNALCTVSTQIHPTLQNLTTNNVGIRAVVPGAGSFVIHLTGDPGASHARVGFLLIQPGA